MIALFGLTVPRQAMVQTDSLAIRLVHTTTAALLYRVLPKVHYLTSTFPARTGHVCMHLLRASGNHVRSVLSTKASRLDLIATVVSSEAACSSVVPPMSISTTLGQTEWMAPIPSGERRPEGISHAKQRAAERGSQVSKTGDGGANGLSLTDSDAAQPSEPNADHPRVS